MPSFIVNSAARNVCIDPAEIFDILRLKLLPVDSEVIWRSTLIQSYESLLDIMNCVPVYVTFALRRMDKVSLLASRSLGGFFSGPEKRATQIKIIITRACKTNGHLTFRLVFLSFS